MTTLHGKAGEPVRLGACIGFAQEQNERMGRLVGIRHDDCRPIERFIIRQYVPGDGEYPTGKYITTWLLVPHTPGLEGCVEGRVLSHPWAS